jgi:hypothetical protein
MINSICELCPNLRSKLQGINQQIPKLEYSPDDSISESNRKRLREFWRANGKSLLNQLRREFINDRQIGYDWQFNKAQKEKLEEYYYGSKLLLACLSQSEIDVSEKQNMKERLLLPIAEIEKRQSEKVE